MGQRCPRAESVTGDGAPLVPGWVNALGAADVIFAIKDERRGPFEALCFASDTLILIQVRCLFHARSQVTI